MTSDGNSFDERIERALDLHREGAFDAAAEIYNGILAEQPDQAEALNFLGLVRYQQGRHDEAVNHLAQAVAAAPHVGEHAFNLGLAQTAAERFPDAISTLGRVLERAPGDPQVLNAYAVALKGNGELEAASSVLRELCTAEPEFAGAHFNLGNVYLQMGRADDAIGAFQRALRVAPGDIQVRRNLAVALSDAGDTADAIEHLGAILADHPGDAASHNNLGNLYRRDGDLQRARTCFEAALAADPKMADAAYNLGAVLADLNRMEDARAKFDQALSVRPGFVKVDWARHFSLPQIYASADERDTARARWRAGLDTLFARDLPVSEAGVREHLAASSEITPFALAYQAENDKDAMVRWGARVSDIACQAFPQYAEPAAIPVRERKRIVFVSAHFRAHTVERLFSGWITGLDRETFEVHLVSTSGPGDARTRELGTHVESIYTGSPTIPALADTIHRLAPDVVIYPDVGMDPRTQVLAALPLGRCQAMAWGHPVTSGSPHMDFFLSSALMEPADGDDHYREKLLRLPNLSIAYARPEAPPATDKPTGFLCAQQLFKVAPEQDQVFAEILRECPNAALRFIRHPIDEVTEAFQVRLGSALRAHGLDPDQKLTFLPPTDRAGFLRYLAGADVILDTFHWSGGNTSLEALATGTPVVTLPGRFMRGRHSAAMLEMMQIGELRAKDAEDYIRIATTLHHDRRWHAHLRSLIEERSPRLFGDPTPIRALNDLLAGL